jgi:hypothetical protein
MYLSHFLTIGNVLTLRHFTLSAVFARLGVNRRFGKPAAIVVTKNQIQPS